MQTESYMLQTNRFQQQTTLQVTLDNDFNVPDTKSDIEKLIVHNGEVHVQNIKLLKDKAIIKGSLMWSLLYLKSHRDCTLDSVHGELPFEEVINMDGLIEDARVRVDWDIEDLRMTMIHSRKISVRSILNLKLMAVCVEEVPALTEVSSDRDAICFRKNVYNMSKVVIRKKDTVRIREEINLTSNKANMTSILWGEVDIQHLDIKMQDDKLMLRGDGALFLLYSGEDEENPFEYVESNVPWHTEIPCTGLTEDMIGNVHLHKISQNLEMKADKDGEMRVILMEMVLDLDMEAYEEERIALLDDVYALNCHIEPVYKETNVEHILIRNQSECKLCDRVPMPKDQMNVLQICHTWAQVRLDRLEMKDNRIQAEGVVDVRVLYVNVDDHLPLDVVVSMIPFSTVIETGVLNSNVRFEVQPYIDQLSAVMTDSENADVKMTIRLDTIVYEQRTIQTMTEIHSSEMDDGYIESLPNMVGYIVQKDDDLFALAKKFYTTKETIMSINGLETDEIVEGERLLMMKDMPV